MLAAPAMASVGANKAIGATSTGRELCWWWQLLGLGQWEKTRGKRDSLPQQPLCVLCAAGGHPLLSPPPQRKSHGEGDRYLCVNHFQASHAP